MKQLLRSALHSAGGMTPLRFLRRAGLRILVYHRFADAGAALARQCAYIRRHYRPVSLDTAALCLEERQAFPPRALAITVDDGYRDFFECAYPVFQSYGIPVTVFLTTGFLDRQCWLWVDQIRYLFEHAPANDRRRGAQELKEELKRAPNGERLRMLAELPASLRVPLPESIPEEYAPLSWDQVRLMRRNGVAFGAHTVTHPILAQVSDCGQVREELARSKARIEEELQEPVLHFAYPNGRREDISDCAREAARAEGFRTAVTTQYGHVSPHDDPFLLKRMVVEPEMPEFWFEEMLEMFRPRAKGIQC
jgi:peptidoglycan/xylan/chitin deacetylase (PgdA/CDA1 family)